MADNPPLEGFLAFWTTYGPALTGGAVIISAICAFAIIFANRAVARRRATLDLILHIESDRELLEARNSFIPLKQSDTRSAVWGAADKASTSEAKAIRTVLNLHELVAVSINEGVIDENVFRRWFNRTFIDDHKAMTGYIEAVRAWKQNPAIFLQFETLAIKWDADITWYDKPGWWRRKSMAFRRLLRA